MDSITLFVLALGLSMDAFAVSISNSMCFSGLRRNEAALTSLSFGVFQGIMPMLGWRLGIGFSSKIEAIDHWIAFGLLVFIGGHMIYEAVSAKEEDSGVSRFNFRELMLMSLATSIDALAVGVSFSLLGADIFVAAPIIAVTTFVCSLIAYVLGKKMGAFLGGYAQAVGGVILIMIGIRELF